MRTLILAVTLAAVPLMACGTTGTTQRSGSGSSRNTITRAQLEAMPSMTVYQAIERYRRDWLRPRGATLQTDTGRRFPTVFMDGRPYGDLEVLSQLGTEIVEEIRYMSASDATTRFGTGYPAGIIDVISRR